MSKDNYFFYKDLMTKILKKKKYYNLTKTFYNTFFYSYG